MAPTTARAALALLIAVLAAVGPLAPGAGAQPNPGPPTVIDGPSPALAAPTGLGMSIARDGTGALVYLKQVAGGPHVFVSTIQGGSFQGPQQLDAGLPGPSSQPVLAAGNAGLAIVAFVNGGQLYVVTRTSYAAAWTGPTALVAGASNPALQMSNYGKAYLAFTLADGSGYDVRTAFYFAGAWAIEGTPLNNIAADNAGTGTGRPAVAAAGDGVGIVAWGEDGHVFTRRVWGIAPSIVLEQADTPPPGCSELSADEPGIGSGGDSSYAGVSFRETVNCGGVTEPRVLVNRLHGSIYDGISQADGLSPSGPEGADQPGVTVGEYGRGWVTSSRTVSDNVYAQYLGDNAAPWNILQINGEANASAPDPVPATAGLYSNLIAWQHDPGPGGSPDIRARYAASGSSSLGPELILSSPAQGPTNADGGLAAGGDVNGDAAVAWLQGSGGSAEIVVDQLYQTPAPVVATTSFRYVRSARVVLSWTPTRASWGPITYTVSVDGVPVGQTGANAFAVPALPDGPHGWQVTAANPAGLTSAMSPVRVFVDTTPPRVSLALTGNPTAGSSLQLKVKATDAPPLGQPRSHASGLAKLTVFWGDGSPHLAIAPGKLRHVYGRPGRYKIRVVAQDRAGNTTTVTKVVKITAAPPKKP